MQRKKLVAGNWKMNGDSGSNRVLLQSLLAMSYDLAGMQCIVCPPFPYLAQVRQQVQDSPIAWGAQNVSDVQNGAYTGEVSAEMLRDLGCTYVIVGHSERRTLYGETNEVVARKFARAQQAGLLPILCVGETLEQREKNVTESVIAAQLDAVVQMSGVAALSNAVIAYEPVWAIGTGKTATPDQAQAVHRFIRQRVAAADATVAQGVQVLYGGSVKAANASELFAMDDIDGGLIGGASLQADEFLKICRAAR